MEPHCANVLEVSILKNVIINLQCILLSLYAPKLAKTRAGKWTAWSHKRSQDHPIMHQMTIKTNESKGYMRPDQSSSSTHGTIGCRKGDKRTVKRSYHKVWSWKDHIGSTVVSATSLDSPISENMDDSHHGVHADEDLPLKISPSFQNDDHWFQMSIFCTVGTTVRGDAKVWSSPWSHPQHPPDKLTDPTLPFAGQKFFSRSSYHDLKCIRLSVT